MVSTLRGKKDRREAPRMRIRKKMEAGSNEVKEKRRTKELQRVSESCREGCPSKAQTLDFTGWPMTFISIFLE